MITREFWKEQIKGVFRKMGIDLTRNMKYDRLTSEIIRSHLRAESNAIDVGAHKGEILELFLESAPGGRHLAFEPIPDLYNELLRNFGSRSTVYPFALADFHGTTTFHIVLKDPAYSGLRQRDLGKIKSHIQEITTEVRTLDELVPEDFPVDLIKIDVEGGEFHVLKGAQRILKQSGPLIIFEFGMGGADKYDAHPKAFFNWMNERGYEIFTLEGLQRGSLPLRAVELEQHFTSGSEYYFAAKPA